MAQAKYTIQVPADPPDLAKYTHHVLVNSIKADGSYIDPGKQSADGVPIDLVVAYAEDEPESDSYIKQLAAYVGDVANVSHILATKEGKQGVTSWPISNPLYA